MPRTPKQPNTQLAELLDEAAMPAKGIARRVVARGTDRGLSLAYDHNSVRRWLEGERPQHAARALIADVLAEALGRHVTPADCGLPGYDDASLEFPLEWTGGIRTAGQLYRADVDRRRALTAGYSPSAYPSAATRWLTHPPGAGPAHKGRTRVGRPEIAAIRQMTRAFYDLDNKVGGGRIRTTVVQYLDSNVAPLLRGTYTVEVGRELFAASAELTKAVGWMAYDCEEHGLAQRYLVQALRMAQTAGDQGLCAEILAAMGHQATYIGRPGEAVDLARAAQTAAVRSGHPALVAECHLIEAHGHAGLADRRATSGALRAGEQAFDADDPDPPDWLAYTSTGCRHLKVLGPAGIGFGGAGWAAVTMEPGAGSTYTASGDPQPCPEGEPTFADTDPAAGQGTVEERKAGGEPVSYLATSLMCLDLATGAFTNVEQRLWLIPGAEILVVDNYRFDETEDLLVSAEW